MRQTYTGEIEIGQRVHCILYGGRNGIVVNIQGRQTPETVRKLSDGFGCAGGNAQFEIVWDDSTESWISESILRASVQWEVYPEVASVEEVAMALGRAATQAIKAKTEAEDNARRFDEEKASLIVANPHLKVAESGTYDGKTAIENVRIELKSRWPGVKFSVRSERGVSSIAVRWTDGPVAHEVDAVLKKYQNGRFDGMDDSYRNRRTPWNTAFGGVDYTHAYREISDDLLEQARGYVYRKLPENLAGIPYPAIQDIRQHWQGPVIPHINLGLHEAVMAVAAAWDTTDGRLKRGGLYPAAHFLLEEEVQEKAA